MKKLILSLLILIFAQRSLSQSPLIPIDLKQHFLQNSEHDKTAAFALLSIGIIALAAGITKYKQSTNLDDAVYGLGLTMTGGGCVLISIPFFFSSKKNKKKSMSIAFRQQENIRLVKSTLNVTLQPTVNLKVFLSR